MNTQRIAIGKNTHTAEWLVSTRAGQAILKAHHGSEIRPRCQCQTHGVEMYVGRRGLTYYLSRMPGTGFLHAEGCSSLEEGSLLTGAFSYAPGAMIETDRATVRLAFNRELREQQTAPLTEVSINGLLDFVIEQADLNRIHPGDPARTWSSVRRDILAALPYMEIGSGSLHDQVFIPKRYERDDALTELAACDQFLQAHPNALIIAPLKGIKRSAYSWQIVVKHLPGLKLWALSETADLVERRMNAPVFHSPPEFALCMIAVKPSRRPGSYTVTNMAILATNANFLPCSTLHEAQVANRLLSEGHSVLRPLRFDVEESVILADFSLIDGDSPIPVFVHSNDANSNINTAKHSLVSLMTRNHIPVLAFDTSPSIQDAH